MKRFLAAAFICGGIVVILVVVRLASSLGSSGIDERTIATAAATVREIEQRVYATGELVATQATEIRSEVSGRVEAIKVKSGERVAAGTVLLELDSAELKSEEQEATFRIEAARLRQERAQMDYDRKVKLRSEKFVMEKELKDAKTELDLATNALDIDRARLQTLREKLEKMIIRAPHDGIVLNLRAREGVVVTGANTSGEATLLMQIADLKQLEVHCEIGEVDVIKVSIGMPASLTFDSLPGSELNGEVRFVSPSALPKERDRTIRVFPMIIAVGATDPQLKPGITANVVISTGKNPQALAVSVGAVFTEHNRPFVFVKNGDRFDRRAVDLGLNDSQFVEVKDGLREGEEVALQHPPEDAITAS